MAHFYFTLLALLACLVHSAKRIGSKHLDHMPQQKRHKPTRPPISSAEIVAICAHGSLIEFEYAVRGINFNADLNLESKEQCIVQSLSHGNLEAFNRLLDFDISISDDFLTKIIRNKNPNFALVCAQRKPEYFIQRITRIPILFAVSIVNAKTAVALHILGLLPSSAIKVVIMSIFNGSNLDLCIRALNMIPLPEQKGVLEALLEKAIKSRCTSFIVWILCKLNLPCTKPAPFTEIIHAVVDSDLSKLQQLIFKNDDHTDLCGCSFATDAVFWFGRLNVYSLITSHLDHLDMTWLWEILRIRKVRMALSSGVFSREYFNIGDNPSILPYYVFESNIKHYINMGQYEHVALIIDSMSRKLRKRKLTTSFPRNTKHRSIINLIYQTKLGRFNRVLCFMDQYPLELMIKFSLIDLWFNLSYEFFWQLSNSARQ